MNGFEHENLDVYRVSIEFLALADEVAGALPRGPRALGGSTSEGFDIDFAQHC